jgi:peptidoglycan/LPS O-acetylase OafA/YrhL
MTLNTYRPDIDGLRAVAVLLVVLFHLDLGVPGGYVGVDVFFVISGYLITGIIKREIERGEFTFAAFYARRARRILPAQMLLLITSSVVASTILLPTDLERFAKSAAAALLSVSNFWFWSKGGYFDPPSVMSPLLHTWSLGVEEQFYVLLPLILVLAYHFKPHWVKWLLIFAAVGTFAASSWFVATRTPEVFYLSPFRAWEFLLGSMLVYWKLPEVTSGLQKQAIALAGLLCVVVPGFLYSGSTVFPGPMAAIPCVGAAVLIWIGTTGDTFVGKFLQNRSIVFLGLISYSLYLWHWPLLVFAKHIFDGNLNVESRLGIGFVSILLASLTWRFIETPFRSKALISNRKAWYSLICSSVALVGVLIGIMTSHGFQSRFAPQVVMLDRAKARDVVRPECIDIRVPLNAQTLCRIGAAGEPNVLVLGDSFAHAIILGFDLAFKHLGIAAWFAAESGCAPLPATRISFGGRDNWRCREFNNKVMKALSEQSGISYLVLTAAWETYSNDASGYKLRTSNSDDAAISLKQGIESFAENLHGKTARQKLIVVSQVPSYEWPVPQKMLRRELKGEQIEPLTLQEWSERSKVSLRIFEQLKNSGQIDVFVDAAAWFCWTGTCRYASDDSRPYYWDGGHVNTDGARFIAPKIESTFRGLFLTEPR